MKIEHPTEFSNVAVKRKQYPVASGVIDYFPNAIAEVAHTSWAGNEQHHPGTPLHWDRSKSTDEADALMRHFVQRGTLDSDGIRHSAKVAWRALALLQKEIENGEEGNQTKRDVSSAQQQLPFAQPQPAQTQHPQPTTRHRVDAR